jgi:DNA mismatch repair protein MSH6
MAKGNGATSSPPNATLDAGALKRSTSSTQNMRNQRSILGFFQKSSPSTPSGPRSVEPASSPAQQASEKRAAGNANGTLRHTANGGGKTPQELPPLPSSDIVYTEDDEMINKKANAPEVLIVTSARMFANGVPKI